MLRPGQFAYLLKLAEPPGVPEQGWSLRSFFRLPSETQSAIRGEIAKAGPQHLARFEALLPKPPALPKAPGLGARGGGGGYGFTSGIGGSARNAGAGSAAPMRFKDTDTGF